MKDWNNQILLRLRPYFFVFILSLPAIWPFFKNGFFETHDGDWMVIRFSAFHQALAAGQFPVRFLDRLNNNYGYPVANFLYPLPFYLAEFPKLLGFGFVESIKIVFVLSSVFSSIIMYWALSKRFSNLASLTGAVIYLWTPYRFVDLYVRGSFGENLAFVFVSLALGSIFQIAKGKKFYYPILSVSIAFLVISHNVIAVLFLPILFLIYLLLLGNKIIGGLLSFALGLMLSAFFWIPAFYDLRYVVLSQVKISNIDQHLTSLKNLFIPSWGFGPTPNGPDFFSPQLGILTIVVFLFSAFYALRKKPANRLLYLLILISLLIIFMMHKISLPIWQKVPLIDIIQFPWRMLSIIVFTASFLAAFLADKVNKVSFSLLIIILAIFVNFPYTFPKNFVQKEDGFYSTNESTTTVRDEYMPVWVNQKPQDRANNKIEIEENKGQIISQNIKNSHYVVQINLAENSRILINTVYFPGWAVNSDRKSVPIEITKDTGLISFQLPKGNHKVIIDYKRTGIHSASELLSLLAVAIISVQVYLWRRQNS